MQKMPNHIPALNKNSILFSETEHIPHEAGYDAYMCGFSKYSII